MAAGDLALALRQANSPDRVGSSLTAPARRRHRSNLSRRRHDSTRIEGVPAVISVLVVDDEPDIRDLISYTLEDCDVRVASNGDQALREVARQLPDVVILDIMMPGMSGLRVLELWRADPVTAYLPVILLTAKAQEAAVDRGFALGANDYVVKPFSPTELARRVAALTARQNRA
jgi:two-component system phosphate regulon response regulator PhoB